MLGPERLMHLGGFLFGIPCGIALRFGAKVYARAVPLLLAISVATALIAAHSPRVGAQ